VKFGITRAVALTIRDVTLVTHDVATVAQVATMVIPATLPVLEELYKIA
jgi:hypothetical protein